MSPPIVEVNCVSKRYRLGVLNAGSLSEELQRLWRRVRGEGESERAAVTDFWALRDITFSVQAGETLGIIGRNGAGKSTLLKILSRITEPTRGEVRMRGRVASLLEVGTGFHPELTGRENIYLNGAILGMTRAEIGRKFDEIVQFSGVEGFLDTPVKRYSSGMHVRLAFAVAAHLEPEVLIVDEVLAVGDAEFQRKCLGKMQSVSGEGRTVLFVSHNSAAIQHICGRCILIEAGRVALDAPPNEALTAYTLSTGSGFENREHGVFIKQLRFLDEVGNVVESACVGWALTFEVTLEAPAILNRPRLSVNILGEFGNRLCCFTSDVQTKGLQAFSGRRVISITTDAVRLAPGQYPIEIALWNDDQELETMRWPGGLFIESADYYGTGLLPDRSFGGYFVPTATWAVK